MEEEKQKCQTNSNSIKGREFKNLESKFEALFVIHIQHADCGPANRSETDHAGDIKCNIHSDCRPDLVPTRGAPRPLRGQMLTREHGSGLGLQNRVNIRLIVEQSKVPVLVDAGVGTASDATLAMELGCDAVLMNTAIAEAKDPIRMAVAMKHAVIAGREAYLSGRMARRTYGDPSSPRGGLI